MGVTKTDNFSQQQNQLATWAKAMAHPARIAILQHLLKVNSCICTDLVEVLPLAQATVSQHLKELKAVGIIQGDIEGTRVCYCINPTTWQQMKSHMEILFTSYTPIDKCC
jgi:DNA-binding transcriptional ArsR family regulator